MSGAAGMRATRVALTLAGAAGLACGGGGAVPGDGGDDGSGDGGQDGAAGDQTPGDAPATGDGLAGDGSGPGASCAPWPAATGTTITLTAAMADLLPGMASSAAPGTTFLLADGTYKMTGTDEGSRRIILKAKGVTLRSASDDASKVVIDGEYKTAEIINVWADDVTIAHVTIAHAIDHPIHIYPPDGTTPVLRPVIYGVQLVDGGEQFVKVNPNAGPMAWVDQGRIECSTFSMTDAGRPHVETLGGTSCYTGGIDVHGGRGWVVRRNHFEGIHCTSGKLAEHAIHFWNGARDTLVEQNTIVDCGRGVGFGLVETGTARPYADDPYPGAGYIGHYDGVIRNNVIAADNPWFDTGIELDQARGARVYHNTVWAGPGATGVFSSIDYRFANTQVTLRNNLVGRITKRDGAAGTVDHDAEGVTAAAFVDAPGHDLHLAAGAGAALAIDKGVALGAEGGLDLDGEAHDKGTAPDLGADER